MHQQITFKAKGVTMTGKISSEYGNVIHFEFFDPSKIVLDTGYRSHFIGIDEYPERRIYERGVEEIQTMFELLFKFKPTLLNVEAVVTEPNDLVNFAKWRDFIRDPSKYDHLLLDKAKAVEPVQLTLF